MEGRTKRGAGRRHANVAKCRPDSSHTSGLRREHHDDIEEGERWFRGDVDSLSLILSSDDGSRDRELNGLRGGRSIGFVVMGDGALLPAHRPRHFTVEVRPCSQNNSFENHPHRGAKRPYRDRVDAEGVPSGLRGTRSVPRTPLRGTGWRRRSLRTW